MHDAFRLYTEGRHLKVRLGREVYENVLITSISDGSDRAATVTLLLPTPIGEPDRFRTSRLDQVEVLP